MGWITSGGIEFYSISDSVSDLANLYFSILLDLFNPFIFLALLLFVVSIILYFFVIISERMKKVEVTP